MVAASGQEREPHKVTFDSNSDVNPSFAPDGKKLFFQRVEGTTGTAPTSIQIYSVIMERLERDPDDPEERAETEPADPAGEGGEGAAPGAAGGRRGPGADRRTPPKEIKVDWGGLKRRTRQVTRMPFSILNFTVAPDSRTVVFVTTEPAGQATVPVVYTIQDDGRRLTRLTTGLPPTEGGPGGGGGFGGGGISQLNVSRDGRTLFFRERDGVYSVAMPPPAPASGAASMASAARTTTATEAPRRRISFNTRVRVDHAAQWAEMFDDGWRTMKYRFYDPQMHGFDWDAARAKYRPLVEYVGDRQELLNILNEMIGELNASHTGAAPPPRGQGSGVSTGNLGLELEADNAAGRYRVTHVYEDGPSDKDWVRVKPGDYLISINGKSVKAGDEYWELLNNRLNRKVEVSFNDKPSEEGALRLRIEAITTGAYGHVPY
jgi:tricorn protease